MTDEGHDEQNNSNDSEQGDDDNYRIVRFQEQLGNSDSDRRRATKNRMCCKITKLCQQ